MRNNSIYRISFYPPYLAVPAALNKVYYLHPQSLFSRKKELFERLAMERLEKE